MTDTVLPGADRVPAHPYPPAPLEDWLRDRYFTARIDISSSGVEPYSLAEVRRLTGLSPAELDEVAFRDSHSLGGEGLRAALADRFADGDTDRVMATHGSSEALSLIAHTLLQPGDHVLVQDPAYHALPGTARALGCRVEGVPVDPPGSSFVDEVLRLVRPGTRMVLLNLPHNPTGGTVDGAAQAAIVAACASVGAYLVWDAAFAELVYDTPPLPDPAGRYPRALSVGTLSKAYGLPGLRVGWCVADPGLLERFVRLRDHLTLSLSPLVELVAEHAVRGADALLAPRLQQARTNRDRLLRWLDAHRWAVECPIPAGGVTAFPRLRTVRDDVAFADRLQRRWGTLVVPGSCFHRPGHLRLGFGGAADQFAEGLDRLTEALETSAGPRARQSLWKESTHAPTGS
jgi:capreomycidine synthase